MNYIRKNYLEVIFGFIIVLIVIFLVIYKSNISNSTVESIYETPTSSIAESSFIDEKIHVYVSGDVYNPGEFDVSSSSTFKVLWIICRPSSSIDPKDYNMSELLVEGRHYVIKKQVSTAPGVLINVNTGTIKQLSLLPGIGEVTATKIVEYRTNNGMFTNLEVFYSLLEGVSDENISTIKEQVTLF